MSLAQAEIANPTVQTLLDGNKNLRFLKTNGDLGLHYSYIGPWSELRLGVYWDGSWASRPDGSSQGGHMLFAILDARVDDGAPTPLVILEWTSRKQEFVAYRFWISGDWEAARRRMTGSTASSSRPAS